MMADQIKRNLVKNTTRKIKHVKKSKQRNSIGVNSYHTFLSFVILVKGGLSSRVVYVYAKVIGNWTISKE